MKTKKLMLAMTVVAMCAAGCGNKKEESKTLVLYYSLTGNTKMVAEEMANRLGADIEEITCVDPYDTNFQACIQRCLQEREAGVLPEINPVKADLSQYDCIVVGYPIWFGTYAPPITTWLNGVDLKGKKVLLFCTFGSGGLEPSQFDFMEQQPEAEVLGCYGVRAARLEAMPKEVEQFLIYHHLIDGELQNVEPWGEDHPVTDEETAVFDAAVDGYPMLHAKAISVTSHPVADGTEYCFIAEDLPREDKPDMPPAGKMQVYVLMTDGQAPVFTRVVRNMVR